MWKPKRCPNCGWLLEPNEADEIKKGQREYHNRIYVHYDVYCNNCGWSGEISEEEPNTFKNFKEC